MPGSQGQVAAGSSRDFDPGETMGTHKDSGLDCILDRQTMLLALGCSRPGDRLSEAIQTPSFRGDAKHRARNLEIPRCAIAHLRSGPSDHPGMTKGGLLRRFRLRSLSYGGQVAPRNDDKAQMLSSTNSRHCPPSRDDGCRCGARLDTVIASASEAIHGAAPRKNGLL